MLPISCVIIARNEAEALKRCLSSIHGWIKEIIVIINDCTDDTQKIAEQFGARVIEHVWEGYARQKNFGISCAQKAWILRLDADEEVSEALKQQIEDFFQKTPPADCEVVYCQRHNRYLNHWLRYGRSKDSCPILLRKRAVKWIGTVHEGLQYSGKKHYLQGPLWHYTETSIEQTLQKQIKYAHLSAPALAQRRSKVLPKSLNKFYQSLHSKRWFFRQIPRILLRNHNLFLYLFKIFIGNRTTFTAK